MGEPIYKKIDQGFARAHTHILRYIEIHWLIYILHWLLKAHKLQIHKKKKSLISKKYPKGEKTTD